VLRCQQKQLPDPDGVSADGVLDQPQMDTKKIPCAAARQSDAG